jgi:hypothetical protein
MICEDRGVERVRPVAGPRERRRRLGPSCGDLHQTLLRQKVIARGDIGLGNEVTEVTIQKQGPFKAEQTRLSFQSHYFYGNSHRVNPSLNGQFLPTNYRGLSPYSDLPIIIVSDIRTRK